jgi:biopolymer transport protein ExbD
MPKFKPHRAGVRIDMTPLVDVAFLLLTFFMLTTQFKPQEEVTIILPASHSDYKLPESDVLTISIGKEAVPVVDIAAQTKDTTHIWLAVDSQILRQRLFGAYKNVLSPTTNKPYGDKYFLQLGFPVPKSQLANYLIDARTRNPRLRTVIKGDKLADYGIAEDVMDILQKTQITRFNLVTELAQSVGE